MENELMNNKEIILLLNILKKNQLKLSENKNNYPDDIINTLENIFNYNENNYMSKFQNMESLLGVDEHLMNFQYNNMHIFLKTNENNKNISEFFYEILKSFEEFVFAYLKNDFETSTQKDIIIKYHEGLDFDIKEYLKTMYGESSNIIYKKYISKELENENIKKFVNISNFEYKNIIRNYDLNSINTSVLKYCEAINELCSFFIKNIELFEYQNKEKIDELKNQTNIKELKNKILIFKSQAEKIQEKIYKATEKEDSIYILYNIENEKRASFKFIAETICNLTKNTLKNIK